MVALPAVGADALVHADLVDAGASVVARVALAVVDVCGRNDRQYLNFKPTRRRCSPSLIFGAAAARLTLVAVSASEALLALAAELAAGLAAAAAVGSAHIG